MKRDVYCLTARLLQTVACLACADDSALRDSRILAKHLEHGKMDTKKHRVKYKVDSLYTDNITICCILLQEHGHECNHIGY